MEAEVISGPSAISHTKRRIVMGHEDVRKAVGRVRTHVAQKNVTGTVYLQGNILYLSYLQTIKKRGTECLPKHPRA